MTSTRCRSRNTKRKHVRSFAAASTKAPSSSAARFRLEPEKAVNDEEIKKAVTLYASFDKDLKPDFAGGGRELGTRYTKADNSFEFEKGYPEKAFRAAPGKGVSGGAFECLDVLPRKGR